ncbi:carbohydrate ABC transporter permease [Saliterribacillus persicus]|uniref:Carbohydrate ABC transporter membrane protein 2 (CUT1 family) n=1 Tax=Saliterribacillus persicus TaxID=930114 RepID=A0A368X5S9_9BACI|nr:carbohydrate ABC transporter permease [Saliterribacillus persicus]RCW63350.1 carbohydrate ABC transporter membrane protein 2 (CUT1 family) [Saliterribacillus persicus]
MESLSRTPHEKKSLFQMIRKHNKKFIGLITTILALLFISPYIYIIFTSIKPSSDAISSTPTFFPRELSIENYIAMFDQMPILSYFFNSFITAFISTVLSVLLGALAAYGLARFSSKLGNVFLLITLCIRMIPMISIAIPMYIIINSMGLIDTHAALIITYTSINVPFAIWLMMGFFNNIPKEFDEAARIDGCNIFTSFIKVILPVSLPGLATTAIFCFMLAWNDFLFALLLTSTNAKTATVGISEFLTAYNLDLGPMTAAAVSFSLPVMLFSILVQRYIVSGMTLGSVKG